MLRHAERARPVRLAGLVFLRGTALAQERVGWVAGPKGLVMPGAVWYADGWGMLRASCLAGQAGRLAASPGPPPLENDQDL
jgi:hypothetical protein